MTSIRLMVIVATNSPVQVFTTSNVTLLTLKQQLLRENVSPIRDLSKLLIMLKGRKLEDESKTLLEYEFQSVSMITLIQKTDGGEFM